MSKYEVCPDCEGEGKRVNPVLSVWTESDRYENPDGFRSMMRGDYDIVCPTCKGKRVVTQEELQEHQESLQDQRTMLAEQGIYPGNPDYALY